MAKKAAALQSFQKCDVANLSIPGTIMETDNEMKQDNVNGGEDFSDMENFTLRFDDDDGGVNDDREKFVFVESEAEKLRRVPTVPSDRIEVAASPR